MAPHAEAMVVLAAAAAGADSVSVSPGIGSAGVDWTRQCELVAQAHSMLA